MLCLWILSCILLYEHTGCQQFDISLQFLNKKGYKLWNNVLYFLLVFFSWEVANYKSLEDATQKREGKGIKAMKN